jgi:TonB family protein
MQTEVYSTREIALAAGVSEEHVLAALARPDAPATIGGFVRHVDAVHLGRMLVSKREETARTGDLAAYAGRPLFTVFANRRTRGQTTLPLAVSSTLHIGLIAVAIIVATFNLAPRAATIADDRTPDPMHLIFLATPGPGGGGGGGGLLQKAPPPKAMREGRQAMSSPLPVRREPPPIVETPKPPEPKPEPPLKAEQLPVVIAPIVTAPADNRSRIGILEEAKVETESHGPGRGGGTGTGTGTGIGQGDGAGVGPGSGGGTGGGPYRPGSGIEPPRLLNEVRADYTEDARRRGISGEVVLEIVVRRDGSVGDMKILHGLDTGLNDRAVQAVRQWRFSPARRLGTPVDVIVEVAVEFKLR